MILVVIRSRAVSNALPIVYPSVLYMLWRLVRVIAPKVAPPIGKEMPCAIQAVITSSANGTEEIAANRHAAQHRILPAAIMILPGTIVRTLNLPSMAVVLLPMMEPLTLIV